MYIGTYDIDRQVEISYLLEFFQKLMTFLLNNGKGENQKYDYLLFNQKI